MGHFCIGCLMRKRGFTLLEMLTVVAIIVVLMALLLPALNRARAQVHIVRCASNLRQITLGVIQYASDFNDALPTPYTNDPNLDRDAWWHLKIGGWNVHTNAFSDTVYVPYDSRKTAGTPWNCPFVPTELETMVKAWKNGDWRWTCHYGMNYRMVAPTQESLTKAQRLHQMPDNKVLLADGAVLRNGDRYYFRQQISWKFAPALGEWMVGNEDAPWPIDRGSHKVEALHGGRINISYLDGHVDSVRELTRPMMDF